MRDKGMRYKEVLRAPLWLIAFVYFLFLSMVLSIWAALGNGPALVTFAVLTVWIVLLYFRTALTIRVDDTYLYVGAAKIEHSFIGATNALNSSQLKLIRTRDADPSAYLAIRFWASKAVKVDIHDSRDTTPYWLISCNNPLGLVEALKS